MHKEIDKMNKKNADAADSRHALQDLSVYVSGCHKEPNDRRHDESFHNTGQFSFVTSSDDCGQFIYFTLMS